MKRNLISRGGGVALALALLTGTTGCVVTSPAQTTKTMAPGDGVNVDMGDLHLRNLALVGGGTDGAATVTGTVDNQTGEDVTLTLATEEGAKASAKVAAGEALTLSAPDGETVTLDKLSAKPGDMVELVLDTGNDDARTATVPVLDAGGHYEDAAPEGWTPAPTPSESETEAAH